MSSRVPAFPLHTFANPALLQAALRHSSLAPRPGTSKKTGTAARTPPSPQEETFERLEFLGDRVVGLVVASLLLERFPGKPEGPLSRHHTALVRAETLAQIARSVALEAHLSTASNEGAFGGSANDTVLSDALEAVIGAIYLDGGLSAAEAVIRPLWEPLLQAQPADLRDPKTRLQEWAQGQGFPLPVYTVQDQTGPAHAPHFQISVSVTGAGEADGQGGSKRTAEQEAALALLNRMEEGSEHDGSR